MSESIIQIIGNYGVVGLLFYIAIKEFFVFLGKKNGKRDGTQDVDIAVLKTQIKEFDKNICLIMTNHLPHIQADISEIKISIAKISEKLGI